MDDARILPCEEVAPQILRSFVELGVGTHYWIHGARGSGKRQAILSAVAQSRVSCDWALVSCSEHSDANSLARACCLQLLGVDHAAAANGLSLLSQLLQAPLQLLESRVIIILDDAQSWIKSATLREQLLVFVRSFQPTQTHNASLFIISTSPMEVFARPELFSFVSVHLAASSSVATLTAARRSAHYWTSTAPLNDSEILIANVATFVFQNPLFDIVRLNLTEKVRIFLMALDIFFEPVSLGKFSDSDSAHLFAAFSKRQASLFEHFLQHRGHDHMPDLSIAAKMLLIAAYLTSSSVKSGRTGKTGRAPRKSTASNSRTATTLKPATLADILTTFKEIARGVVHNGFELKSGTSAPILAEIADLVSLGLINKVGQKYQCATTMRTVNAMCETLRGFKLELWH